MIHHNIKTTLMLIYRGNKTDVVAINSEQFKMKWFNEFFESKKLDWSSNWSEINFTLDIHRSP